MTRFTFTSPPLPQNAHKLSEDGLALVLDVHNLHSSDISQAVRRLVADKRCLFILLFIINLFPPPHFPLLISSSSHTAVTAATCKSDPR